MSKESNIIVLFVVGGALSVNVLFEGLHVEAAKLPHIPHQHYPVSAEKDLTYFVSGTTANTIAVASATIFEISPPA